MRKALATIGLVAVLAALESTSAEAGGNMRGQQWRGHSGHSHRQYYSRYPYYYRSYYFPPYYYSSFFYATPAYVTPGYSFPGYYYSAPPGFYNSLTAPQLEREVIFPEGRYFLQGDGNTVPFRWVWVPNPPTAPPADTPDPR